MLAKSALYDLSRSRCFEVSLSLSDENDDLLGRHKLTHYRLRDVFRCSSEHVIGLSIDVDGGVHSRWGGEHFAVGKRSNHHRCGLYENAWTTVVHTGLSASAQKVNSACPTISALLESTHMRKKP